MDNSLHTCAAAEEHHGGDYTDTAAENQPTRPVLVEYGADVNSTEKAGKYKSREDTAGLPFIVVFELVCADVGLQGGHVVRKTQARERCQPRSENDEPGPRATSGQSVPGEQCSALRRPHQGMSRAWYCGRRRGI